jgi:spoIIIJ-associated protein
VTENPVSSPNPSRRLQEITPEAVSRFFGDLILRMGLELEVQVGHEGGTWVVNLTGPDRPLLLSGTAALLNSIEYLANRVFHGSKEEATAPLVLDSDKYRQHRESELILLAQMASKKVLAQRKPLSLQPMIPRERRIVHLALAEIEGVRSQSEGEGDNRSITIYPS